MSYEIEIPEAFCILECPICGTEHAAIRLCPEPEGPPALEQLETIRREYENYLEIEGE